MIAQKIGMQKKSKRKRFVQKVVKLSVRQKNMRRFVQ